MHYVKPIISYYYGHINVPVHTFSSEDATVTICSRSCLIY